MTGDLRWTSTSLVEGSPPGTVFRDADGRYWTFDSAAARWLRHTGSRWRADDDPPRSLEGARGPLTAVRAQPRSPVHAADALAFLERRVADVARAYRAGELTDGQAQGVLLGLAAADAGGWLWTVGPRTGSWYVLEGGSWRPADRPTLDRFTARPDPAAVARRAGTPAGSLLPEPVTTPWDPPPAPAPAAARAPAGRASAGVTGTVARARRLVGVLTMVVGLVTTATGLARTLPGGEQRAAAAPTATTGAPAVAPTTPMTTAGAPPSSTGATTPTTTATTAPSSTTTPSAATTAPPPPTERPTEPPTTSTATAPPTSGRVETALVPVAIQASSWLEPSARASYEPALAFDGRDDTAWCVKGDGVGQSLVIDLRGRPTVTRVGLVPGYDKIDSVGGVDRWTQNRRVTGVVWSFTSEASYTQEPHPDDRSVQLMPLPTPEDGSHVFLTITATLGEGDTCVSEIVLAGDPGGP